MSKLIDKISKKVTALCLSVAMLANIFLPMSVMAISSTNKITISFRDGYTSEQGMVQYSLDDGANWTTVTSNISNQNITVTGNNLKIKVVPNSGYEADFSGTTYSEDGTMNNLNSSSSGPIVGALMGQNGYQASSSASHVKLEGVEFRQKNNNQQNNPVAGPEPGESYFDGKAYVVWSCGNGTCYHYFDDIPSFNDGSSTYYKASSISDDNNASIKFDVDAKVKGWVLKDRFDAWVSNYKSVKGVSSIDWTKLDTNLIAGDPQDMREWEDKAIKAGACSKETMAREEFEPCVDSYAASQGLINSVKLQPLPDEPTDNNAYVSYGDRNFKVVIYNEKYEGISIGDLSDLSYYPAAWTNPFIRQDQFDISGTTKENPTVIDTVLLEKTININTLNYNALTISSIEALDVPNSAVKVVKTDGKFKITFNSNFYDKVVFKVTTKDGKISYFQVNRKTVDANLRHINNKPAIVADFYFDRTKSYKDFELTAKIVYKDGTSKRVSMESVYGIDDGLGNITEAYEVDEEIDGEFGAKGKGLKKSTFSYKLSDEEVKKISKVYVNVENKGSTSTSYAGAFAGSNKGIVIDFEEEK